MRRAILCLAAFGIGLRRFGRPRGRGIALDLFELAEHPVIARLIDLAGEKPVEKLLAAVAEVAIGHTVRPQKEYTVA